MNITNISVIVVMTFYVIIPHVSFLCSDWSIERARFCECHTILTMAIYSRVGDIKKIRPREIYAPTVRIEKSMAAVAAFLVTS